MDKYTLKSLIVELKDNGYTFGEISDILFDQYNIGMSRQAICGMYNRTVKKTDYNNQLMILTSDILNMYALGLDNKSIKEFIKQDSGVDITLTDIAQIIDNNPNILDSIKQFQISILEEAIRLGIRTEECKNTLKFKDISPTDCTFNKLMQAASISTIKQSMIKELANIYKCTEDRNLIKLLIDKHNLDITFKEIGKELSKREGK